MISSQEMISYLAATLTTASFIPQAILTIKTKDTDGLSLSMYSMFTVGVLLWLIYAVYIEDEAIIIANVITLMLAGIILTFKIYNSFFKQN